MKRFIFFLVIITGNYLFYNCKGPGENNVPEEQTEVPPSLRSGQDSVSQVRLNQKEMEELKIQTFAVSGDIQDYELSAPGVVFPSPEHSSIISSPINGQISRINKKEGEWVRAGEVLFNIQSLEFGSMVSDYLSAFAEEQYQTNNLERIQQLVKETISSDSELEQAKAEYQRTVVSARAAYSKLKAIGVPDMEIKSFTESENIDPIFKIRSPISGIIQQNFVELGQSINALENLSRVLDSRNVLVRGYLNPNDARMVKQGDPVIISKRDNKDLSLMSTVASVNPGLDESSKSVIVNIYTSTEDGWPKPGENVHLDIKTSSEIEIIIIPVEAISYDGNDAIVFVEKSNTVFEMRKIVIERLHDDKVFVEKGLSEGEKIAVSQVFSLKALSRMDINSEE